jgi:hypothetical protein
VTPMETPPEPGRTSDGWLELQTLDDVRIG